MKEDEKMMTDLSMVKDETVEKWSQLAVLSRHWKADLEFFKDELRFLRHLLEKKLIWLMDDQNIEAVRKVINSILRLEKRRNALVANIEDHLGQLTALMQNPFATEHQKVEESHEETGRFLLDFLNEFRAAKKEVFVLTEAVLDSEKANLLLRGD